MAVNFTSPAGSGSEASVLASIRCFQPAVDWAVRVADAIVTVASGERKITLHLDAPESCFRVPGVRSGPHVLLPDLGRASRCRERLYQSSKPDQFRRMSRPWTANTRAMSTIATNGVTRAALTRPSRQPPRHHDHHRDGGDAESLLNQRPRGPESPTTTRAIQTPAAIEPTPMCRFRRGNTSFRRLRCGGPLRLRAAAPEPENVVDDGPTPSARSRTLAWAR